MVLFTNEREPVKIRIGEPSNCYWSTIEKGESVDLPLKQGRRLGFKLKTTEGKIGDEVVETKQIEVPEKQVQNDFFKELCSINGIGKKTAKDLVIVFQTRESLIDMIKSGKAIPIRDDIEKLLREKYGKNS